MTYQRGRNFVFPVKIRFSLLAKKQSLDKMPEYLCLKSLFPREIRGTPSTVKISLKIDERSFLVLYKGPECNDRIVIPEI